MVSFASLAFIFRFLPVFLIIYYVVPSKYRDMVLLFGSYVFYAMGDPYFIALLILLTLLNYFVGNKMKGLSEGFEIHDWQKVRQKIRQKVRQKGNFMERDYEEIFQKVLDYEQTLHEKNRKRIKIGLKCIWIVPLFFLALLFLTGSNKVIFLILWIVSLFALSIYLIVVEYMDHNLQEKIMELKGEEGTIEAVTPADFDRAAQIIRKTREMIGEGLNSPAETQAEDGEDGECEK